MGETLRRRLPLVMLAATALVLFYRLLLGEAIYWGTPMLQFIPWRQAAFDALRSGRLPLWNSLVGNGAPLLANYQTAVFYPPNWLNMILPADLALGWIGLLHVIWAGLGMAAYLRRLGADTLGQGVGALSFALSGYLISRFSFMSITSTVPWLPWLMWAVDGLLAVEGRQRLKRTAVLSAITGMLLLAGHAQSAYYCLVMAGAYTIYRVGTSDGSLRTRVVGLGLSLAGVALGVALALIQLVPTYELMAVSQRAGGVTRQIALNFSYAPARALTLLSPNLFGTPARGDYYTPGAYWEDAAYVGLFTLVAALRAAVRWWTTRRAGQAAPIDRPVPFLLGSLPLIFLLAMGQYTPVFPFFYDHVPTFDLFQAPVRWLLLAVFALSALGGIGASHWEADNHTSKRGAAMLVVGLAILIGAAVSGFTLGTALPAPLLRGIARTGGGLALVGLLVMGLALVPARKRLRPGWEALALLLLSVDLVSAHWGLNPTVLVSILRQPSPLAAAIHSEMESPRVFYSLEAEDAVKFGIYLDFHDFKPGDLSHWAGLRASLLPNINMLDGVPGARNFDPLQPNVHILWLAWTLNQQGQAGVDALRQAHISVVLTPLGCGELAEITLQGPIHACRVPDPWPRAYLARCDPGGYGLVCAPSEGGAAQVVVDEAERVVIDVDASEPACLVLSDTYYPGWEARVDGEPVEIRPANITFRCVSVPAGNHQVTFEYRPASLRIGAVCSAVGLFGIIMLWVLSRERRLKAAGSVMSG